MDEEMQNLKQLEKLILLSQEYLDSLNKAIKSHEDLKQKLDKMYEALSELRRSFGQDDRCGVCFARSKNTALDCGHLVCNRCASRCLQSQRCPFCRKTTTELLKIFL